MIRELTSLLIAAAVAASAPVAAQARPQMRSVFQDDCLLVQITADPHCAGHSRTAALDDMKALGADTIRLTMTADQVDSVGFGSFDPSVNGARSRGMQPLLSLTTRLEVPSTARFSSFVTKVVKHYPQVHLWSLLNEPNLRYFFGIPPKTRGKKTRNGTAREWRTLFVAGQKALRAVRGHGRDTVLLGELAPRATANNGTAQGPLKFTREFFCLDAKLRPYTGGAARSRGCTNFKRVTADGFAFHPYTNAALAAPNFKDPGDGAAIATLDRITKILDAAARRGRTNRNMSVWDTEMGFQSNPPDRRAPSPTVQAEYVNWGDWIQYRNPRVASVSQYELTDAADREAYNTGLRFISGKRKPAYDAYRLGIYATRAGRSAVRVWANSRPGGAQSVTFLRQSNGRGPFRKVATKRTNSTGYVEPQFRGGTKDRWQVKSQGFTSRTARVR